MEAIISVTQVHKNTWLVVDVRRVSILSISAHYYPIILFLVFTVGTIQIMAIQLMIFL